MDQYHDDLNGEGTVGVKEIARLANVSLATVDRVLHNRSGVSEKTRRRVEKIIKQLDYRPNIMARRLASGKVYRFAAFIPAVSDETNYWEAPLSGITRAASELAQYGIRMDRFLFNLNDKRSFVEQGRRILEAGLDGVVVAPSFVEESVAFTTACNTARVPYVFINSDIPAQRSLAYIGPELFKSGYLAGSLACLGHGTRAPRKILVVNIAKALDRQHHVMRKEDGFRRYFEDHGIDTTIVEANIEETSYPQVEHRLRRVMNEHPDIQSIFVTNSRVFFVARFLEKQGLDGIHLIGYDYIRENIDYLRKGRIAFLICQKPEEQGYRGVMALYHHLILKIPIPDIEYMPIDIITRENYEFYRN